jgi:hypothetical protein
MGKLANGAEAEGGRSEVRRGKIDGSVRDVNACMFVNAFMNTGSIWSVLLLLLSSSSLPLFSCLFFLLLLLLLPPRSRKTHRGHSRQTTFSTYPATPFPSFPSPTPPSPPPAAAAANTPKSSSLLSAPESESPSISRRSSVPYNHHRAAAQATFEVSAKRARSARELVLSALVFVSVLVPAECRFKEMGIREWVRRCVDEVEEVGAVEEGEREEEGARKEAMRCIISGGISGMNTLFVCVLEGEVDEEVLSDFPLVFLLVSILALVLVLVLVWVSCLERARVLALALVVFVLVLVRLLASVANSSESDEYSLSPSPPLSKKRLGNLVWVLVGGAGKEDMRPGDDWHLVRSYPSRGRARVRSRLSEGPRRGSGNTRSEGSLTNGIHDISPSFPSVFPFSLSLRPSRPRVWSPYSNSSSESTLGPSPSGRRISGLGGDGERLEYLDEGLRPWARGWGA